MPDDNYLCPACGCEIDIDDIDVNDNTEDGYGDMLVPCTCPHCGKNLTAHFDAENGYDFTCFTID